MAQIIKHRRGSLEALSAVTSSLQKGELVIASGSSNLTVTNGSSLVFAVPADGQVQATNRFLMGDAAPNNFAGSTYNGMVKGVPYYASGSSTLYLLGTDGNEAINLVGNIQPFSSSVATSINALSQSIGSGTIGNSVNQLNAFTASAGIRLNNLESTSASVNTSIEGIEGHIVDINAYTASNDTTNSQQDGRLDVLEAKASTLSTYTASVNGHISDINAYTASNNTTNTAQNSRLTNLEATSASVNGHISDINTKTGSFESKFATLATYTSSVNSRLDQLSTDSGSQSTRLTDLETFQSDVETAITLDGQNVTINGNFIVSGTQTIVDSTTVQLGDNIIELNGSGAANGGLWVKDVTNPNTATGSIVWDSTNDYWKAGVKGSEIKVLLAGGDGVVSGSAQITAADTVGFDSSVKTKLNVEGVISGSSQVNADSITNFDSNVKDKLNAEGVVSGSSQITISDTTGFSTFSSSIATNVVELFGTASNHESRLDTIEASVGGGGSVSTRIDQLSAATASVNSFTSSTLGHIADINAYTASNDTKNSEQDDRLVNLEATSASVNTSIDSIEGHIADINTWSGSVKGHISDINTWSGSAKTSITNLEAKASTLQTYTASVDGHISDINSWSSSVKGHIADINAYTASNNTTNTAQSARLTTIEAFTASFSTSVDARLDTLEGTGTIQGLGTGNNVTFAKVTTTGDVVVGGDLVVQGNTVTLNTAQLVVEDKVITLASGSTSNATADGAGFEIAGTSASFKYDGIANQFSSSVDVVANLTGSINLPTGGSSKRLAFRNTNGNLDLITAPSTAGDIAQWNGTDFVMSNVIDGGSF